MIDRLSSRHKDNLDWWVSGPASRNTLASPLFHYCCVLLLLLELRKTKVEFEEIEVDSVALQAIIKEQILNGDESIPVCLHPLSARARLKKKLLLLYALLYTPLLNLLPHLLITLLRYRPRIPRQGKLTLVDVFSDGRHIGAERYFPHLLDHLSADRRKFVFFVPTFVQPDILKLLRYIPTSFRRLPNRIYKECFLKWRDYLHAWLHWYRVRKLKIEACRFASLELSALVKEELRAFQVYDSSFKAILNHCFAKRLKAAGVQLNLVIDWFENQSIDRGWNSGFRRYYAAVPTKGYQGYTVSPHYLCISPSPMEVRCQMVPHKLAVMGAALRSPATRFAPLMKTEIAPAFRFSDVWNPSWENITAGNFAILVALPIAFRDVVYILDLVIKAAGEAAKEIEWRVKPHPAQNTQGLLPRYLRSSANIKTVAGRYEDWLEKSDLVVSTFSSVCLETLARGIPVAVIDNPRGPSQNPLPDHVDRRLVRTCRTAADLVAAIAALRAIPIKDRLAIGRAIRQDHFTPVTTKGVRRFLDLPL